MRAASAEKKPQHRALIVNSNDLAIGPTTERMEPVPAIAPPQGQPGTENRQNSPRRRPPAEPTPASDEETAGSTSVSDAEDVLHRVDNLV